MTNQSVNDASNPFDSPASPAELPQASPQSARSRQASAIIRGNMLLIALFAAGLLGVYLLSLRGGPAKASAQQLQAQRQVDEALRSMSVVANGDDRSAKSIVDTFYQEAKLRQIPLKKLKVNPFVFRLNVMNDSVTPTPANPSGLSVPTLDDPSSVIEAVKQLSLQTILSGADGKAKAMISNNLLSEGQGIAGWTISKINPRDVVLTWKDQTYTLKLPD